VEHADIDSSVGPQSAPATPYDTVIIANGFFGYAAEIAAHLEAHGRHVARFEDRPSVDTFTKTVIRINPELMAARSERFFEGIGATLAAHPIRDVLIIRAEAVSIATIRMVRKRLPKARFTLYYWDSYRNLPPTAPAKVDLVDRAFSFDLEDTSRDARLTYRPLFYLPQYRDIGDAAAQHDIDLLFVGTLHSDRSQVLRRLLSDLPAALSARLVLFVRSRLAYEVQRLASPTLRTFPRSNFIFKAIGASEVASLMQRSRVILDIERAIQTGYTIRTFEVLAAGRKLITTNARVREADFFNPGNVAVIDRHRPRVDPDFWSAPYERPRPDILERYSLAAWLDEVMPGYQS